MRTTIASIALLSFFFISIPALSQTSSNSQVTGVVSDSTGALLPGVTVKVTKTDTGVVTTVLTNESGVYTLQGLQPGSGYTLSASLPGFQTFTYTDVELSAATVARRNFTLQVAGQTTNVEVSVPAGLAALTETSSVGDVLPEYRIKNLPLVGNNVLNLLNILPGVRFNGTGTWMGDYANTVAGQGLNSINVTLDGMPTRDERFSAQAGTFQGVTVGGTAGGDFGASQAFFSDYTGNNQMLSTTTINPDMVGEIRLVLSPVDAELGRGNSQVQMTTRSGTNKFTGAAVWNVQNTALNPNTWNNNNDRGPGPNRKFGVQPSSERNGSDWNPTMPDWRNVHQYTISYGGPLIKNKTFFFVLWDQQISNTRGLQTDTVLTDTARNGIFRFWEGWNPGNISQSFSALSDTNNNPTAPSIDLEGKPLAPPFWPNGAAYNGSQAGVPAGRLVCFSIFGTVKADGSPFSSADCGSGTDSAGRPYTIFAALPPGGVALWDPKRPDAAAARLGYFANLLQAMPKANLFTGGDGLNRASFRWLRSRTGGNDIANGAGGANAGQNALVGSAAYQNRKQINIKIDQNFRQHRIAATWTHQVDSSTSPVAGWPTGFSGLTSRHPQILNFNVTSTLSPTMLNEGRFGINIDKASTINPWNISDASVRDAVRQFMLSGGASLSGNGQIYPILVNPTSSVGQGGPGQPGVTNSFGGLMSTTQADVSFSNPLFDVSDTFSWSHQKHSFKFGADFRFPRSDGYNLQPIPLASYGNIGGSNTASPFVDFSNSGSLGSTGTPSAAAPAWISNLFPQNARTDVANLAYVLTNSLGSVNTPRWAENSHDVSLGNAGWQDVTTQPNRVRHMVFNDFSLFAKDDYKLTPDLTLNLGLRYEYYIPPYISSGLTSTLVDQGNGLYGPARSLGGGVNSLLQPGNLFITGYGTAGTGPFTNGLGSSAVTLSCSKTAMGTLASRLPTPNCDPNAMSTVEFVGPNSPNPNKTIIARDRNNFGPAVGFAWQLPWFGRGKTTMRGGYQITFERVAIGEQQLASALGANQNTVLSVTGLTTPLLFSDLPALVPVPPTSPPGGTIPIYARSAPLAAFDPKLATPYTQNLTLSVTRSLSRNLTLDVKYVGSLTRKTLGSINVNSSTVYYNPELFNAFEAARRGENPPLLDQMLAGLDLAGTGTTTWTNPAGVSGSYPTDLMYGPVGTCTTLATTGLPAGSTVPTGFQDDPHCAAGQFFNYGGEHLRRATQYGTAGPLANGNFGSLANVLAGSTDPTGGLQPLGAPTAGINPQQRVLRNGCDRIANGLWDSNSPTLYPSLDSAQAAQRSAIPNAITSNIPTRCFPENYLIANPQLSNATLNGNFGRNNFHSVQVQVNMRPTHGFSFQSTYVLAKAMGLPTNTPFTDPLNREFDYQLGSERKHSLLLNGTVELPIGPNKLFFANSSGWVARVIEGWQTSFILNMSSGTPASATGAGTTRYGISSGFVPTGNNRFVPTQYWKIPKGEVKFGGVPTSVFSGFGLDGPFGRALNEAGTYFGIDAPGNLGSYTSVLDPACSDPSQVSQIDSKGFAFASTGSCTLRALAQRVAIGSPDSFLLSPTNPSEVAAQYVLLNPKPGQYGVLSPNVLTSFGTWTLDATIQKSFTITESKRVTLRIDATNVLNHPQPFIPVFSTSTGFTSFGIIECGCADNKSGTRTFQGQVRLSF